MFLELLKKDHMTRKTPAEEKDFKHIKMLSQNYCYTIYTFILLKAKHQIS